MSESKYTPGPWEPAWHEGDHGRATVKQKRDPDNPMYVPIAAVCELYSNPGSRYFNEAEANAHLIAAAPEMLEMLILLWGDMPLCTCSEPTLKDAYDYDCPRCGWWTPDDEKKLKQLIAKVEGKTGD